MTNDEMTGLIDLSDKAFHKGLDQVQRIHRGIAKEPFSVLSRVPVTREPSQAVEVIHNQIADLTYNSIRLGGKAVFLAARKILELNSLPENASAEQATEVPALPAQENPSEQSNI